MTYLTDAGNMAKTLFEENALVTTVTLTPVTRSISNIEGDETFTEGTPQTITCYIVRTESKWTFDKSGLIEGGDAMMLVRASQTVRKDYKVTWNNNTYRIQDVLSRDQPGTGITVYKKCNLFLIDSENTTA